MLSSPISCSSFSSLINFNAALVTVNCVSSMASEVCALICWCSLYYQGIMCLLHCHWRLRLTVAPVPPLLQGTVHLLLGQCWCCPLLWRHFHSRGIAHLLLDQCRHYPLLWYLLHIRGTTHLLLNQCWGCLFLQCHHCCQSIICLLLCQHWYCPLLWHCLCHRCALCLFLSH